MSSENHRIDKYQYELINEFHDGQMRSIITLFLYGEQRQLLCALACIPGKKEFAKSQMTPNGHISAEIGEYQMTCLVDLLRNERPVYIGWETATASVRISTSKEPVGEQELRKMFSFLYV